MGMIISNLGSNWNGIIQATFLINVILYVLAASLLIQFVLKRKA